jgi:phage-related protein
MTEVARATVTIIPNMKGAQSTISDAMTGAGESGAKSFTGSFGSSFKTGAIAGIFGALTSKVADGAISMAKSITQSAYNGYAEYEQLVGGVETLYGDAASTVKSYAADAWQSVGMSQNEYMSTATAFAATLRQAVGGNVQKAAEQSNKALQEMADNANKMGTDMSSVQYAFQGFAKQNYTMLDNLKLGYGGTKEEMERLLSDAEKITGVKYDINNFSDVIDAIGVIQDQLGITGTTAKEASSTIEGSVNSMKAAWSNWMAGLMDDQADMGQLTQNLVDAVGKVAENIGPKLAQVGTALGAALPVLVEGIMPYVPQIVGPIAQGIMSALGTAISQQPALGVVMGIMAALKVGGIVSQFSSMADAIAPFTTSLTSGMSTIGSFSGALQGVISFFTGPLGIVIAIGAVVAALVWFFTQTETGKQILSDFSTFLMNAWNAVLTFFQNLPANIGAFLTTVWTSITTWAIQIGQAAITAGQTFLTNVITFFSQLPGTVLGFLSSVLANVANWVIQMAQNALSAGQQFLSNIISFFSQLPGNILNFLSNVIANVASWVIQMAQNASNAGRQFIQNVANFLHQLPGNVARILSSVISNAGSWVGQMAQKGAEGASRLGSSLISAASSIPGRMLDIGRNIVRGVWNGITGAAGWFASQVRGFFSNIVSNAKSALGIGSPSKVFADEVGQWIPAGINVGFESSMPDVQTSMKRSLISTADTMSASVDLGMQTSSYDTINTSSPSAEEIASTLVKQLTSAGLGKVVVPVYIGGRKLDEVVAESIKRNAYRSGGR